MNSPHHPFHFARDGLVGLPASPTLEINERIKEMLAAGEEVFHLGFGESRFPVHPILVRALQANAQQRSYLPVLGIPELRAAIAEYYNHKFDLQVSADRVVIGPGSKSLLFALMQALDADILLPTPAWVSYEAQAQLARRPVMTVLMDPQADYAVEADRLTQALDQAAAQPNLLLLNTPHNPTGTVLSPERVQAAAEFARARNMVIFSDEIYSLVTHAGEPFASPAQYYPEGTIVFGGLSKHLSLGGWRFGLAILPPGKIGAQLARALQAIAGCIWSCVAGPVQYAALEAYRGNAEIEGYIEACTRLHAARTRSLYEAFVEFGLQTPQPGGGFYLYPSFARWREPLAARGVHTDRDLAMHMLADYRIAMLPGSAFGDEPQALTVRVSTSYLDAETDEQAAALMAAYEECADSERIVRDQHPRLRRLAERFGEFVGELEREL
ncbi:MAG: pyridoxal phosphate-dependent aminotransferase [Anaerolineales bacterium]